MPTKESQSEKSLKDLQMDVRTVMARIRETMVEDALEDDVAYPTFAAARARSGGGPTRFPEEMYYQLERANLTYDQVLAELAQSKSQVPVLGWFVNRFKRELHRLVVFYVNMVAERQVVVNDALVRTLNQLVAQMESSPGNAASFAEAKRAAASADPEQPVANAARPTVEDLYNELTELRERVERLAATAKSLGAQD